MEEELLQQNQPSREPAEQAPRDTATVDNSPGDSFVPDIGAIDNISSAPVAAALASQLNTLANSNVSDKVKKLAAVGASAAARRAAQITDEESNGVFITPSQTAVSAFSGGFAHAMSELMTSDEKDYMRNLDTAQRDNFMRIKYHTLSEEDKNKIPEEDRKKAEDLGELKQSLNEMEQHKKEEIDKKAEKGEISRDEAETKKEHVREKFKHAHECVDHVHEGRERVKRGRKNVQDHKDSKDPLSDIMHREDEKHLKKDEEQLKKDETKMRESLQEGVINDALMEKGQSQAAKSKEQEKAPQIALAQEGHGHGLSDAVRRKAVHSTSMTV